MAEAKMAAAPGGSKSEAGSEGLLKLADEALAVLFEETQAFRIICEAIGVAGDTQGPEAKAQLAALEALRTEVARSDSASLSFVSAVVADMQSAWTSQHKVLLMHLGRLVGEHAVVVQRLAATEQELKAVVADQEADQRERYSLDRRERAPDMGALSPVSHVRSITPTTPPPPPPGEEGSSLGDTPADGAGESALSDHDLMREIVKLSFEEHDRASLTSPPSSTRETAASLSMEMLTALSRHGTFSDEASEGYNDFMSPRRSERTPSARRRRTLSPVESSSFTTPATQGSHVSAVDVDAERSPEAVLFDEDLRESDEVRQCVDAFAPSLAPVLEVDDEAEALLWLPMATLGRSRLRTRAAGPAAPESAEEDTRGLVQVCWTVFQHFRKDLRHRPGSGASLQAAHPFNCITLSGFRKLLKAVNLVSGGDAKGREAAPSGWGGSPAPALAQSLRSRGLLSLGKRDSAQDLDESSDATEASLDPEDDDYAAEEVLAVATRLSNAEIDLIYCMQSKSGADSRRGDGPGAFLSSPGSSRSMTGRSPSGTKNGFVGDLDFVAFLDALASVATKACGQSLSCGAELKARALFALARQRLFPFVRERLTKEVRRRQRSRSVAGAILEDPRIRHLVDANEAMLEALYRCYVRDGAGPPEAAVPGGRGSEPVMLFGNLVSLARDFGLCPIYLSIQTIGDLFETVYYEQLASADADADEAPPRGLGIEAFKTFVSRAALWISPHLSLHEGGTPVEEAAVSSGALDMSIDLRRDEEMLGEKRDKGYLGMRRVFLVMNASSGRNHLMSRNGIVPQGDVIRKGFQAL